MADNLPAAPLSDDLIDRVAKEIAANVSDHIEMMYPAAAQAVAWRSASRSVQGLVRNLMSEIGREAEAGRADICLKNIRKRRLGLRSVRRQNKEGKLAKTSKIEK